MRIVTRPDFDGVVCAVLLRAVFGEEVPIHWVEPFEVQNGEVDIFEGDILANLPWAEGCTWWFDHHITNEAKAPYKGEFRVAPSAAGIIFDHFHDKLERLFTELSAAADKIDSADFTPEEIEFPENDPYAILSMTISGGADLDQPYLEKLCTLLMNESIETIIEESEISARCSKEIKKNREFKKHLRKHTTVENGVALSDFRSFTTPPNGNRFLIYSLFPEAFVSIRLRYKGDKKLGKLVASVGHSIINRTCNVNVGELMAEIGGGGHRAAGSCSFQDDRADEVMAKIISRLKENKSTS